MTAAELQNIAMRLSSDLFVRYTLHRKTMSLECLGPDLLPRRVLPLERLGFTWDAGAGRHWIKRTREGTRSHEGVRSEGT